MHLSSYFKPSRGSIPEFYMVYAAELSLLQGEFQAKFNLLQNNQAAVTSGSVRIIHTPIRIVLTAAEEAQF